MRIVRAVVIDRHIDDVFAYVSDALNDPQWCAKVLSVEQVAVHDGVKLGIAQPAMR